MRWGKGLGPVVALCAVAATLCACGGSAASPYFSRHVEIVPFKGIAFPDTSHAWLAGTVWSRDGLGMTGGAILATTDGGTLWKQQESARTWTPYSVTFANDRCGWMLGSAIPNRPDYNTVLATTDGGAAWEKQDTGTSGTADELSDIACAGATHAWAVGDGAGVGARRGLILATTDGGATWRRGTVKGSLVSVTFADASHGWVVGSGGILGTTDGGRTWKQEPSAARYDLTTVVCANANDAWAMGYDDKNQRNVVLATNDGGTTWKVRYATRAGYWYSMAFADASHGWLVGSDGLILTTSDGGATWQRQLSRTKLDLTAVAFADATHGLVAGRRTKGDDPMSAQFIGSIILRTTDGGATWTK